jgi:hypothetical protein
VTEEGHYHHNSSRARAALAGVRRRDLGAAVPLRAHTREARKVLDDVRAAPIEKLRIDERWITVPGRRSAT